MGELDKIRITIPTSTPGGKKLKLIKIDPRVKLILFLTLLQMSSLILVLDCLLLLLAQVAAAVEEELAAAWLLEAIWTLFVCCWET